MRRRIAGNDSTRTRALAWPAEAGRMLLDLVVLGALGLFVLAGILLFATGAARAEPASLAPDAMPESPALISVEGARNLDELLLVPPVRDTRTAAERCDASLAEAVAQGTGQVPVKHSGFRKRNIDLFRAERPVEIGEQEMLLRVRLRPKTRETMSLELRF